MEHLVRSSRNCNYNNDNYVCVFFLQNSPARYILW